MAESLTEKILKKQILVKEVEAERYIKQYMVIANVRYSAYLKTRPMGLTFYPLKARDDIHKLSREASKNIIVLIATGSSKVGHIKALMRSNSSGEYEIVNHCFYHIDPQTNILSVDGVETTKGFRGNGVGSAVLNFVKDIAISSNCSAVELDSVKNAIGFYSKLGFATSGSQTCPKETLQTMCWNVEGGFNTKKFTVNPLNLMIQRGNEFESKNK